jgi:AcrR family transcriptional regulator
MARSPEPVQQRAVATVRAAIDATTALIEELGEDRVRLQDVTARSGVTNGSLVHHFGSREGLVAAALATRFDGAVVDRIRMFDRLSVGEREFGEQLARIMVDVSGAQRGAARRARFRALSFARHRPELREVLAESFRPAERAIAERLPGAAGGSILAEGVTASALAAFAETYSVGLLLEDVLVPPLPPADWDALFLVVMGAVITPEVLEQVRTSAGGAAAGRDRADAAASRPDRGAGTDGDRADGALPAWPTLELTEDERRIVDHTIGVLHTLGDEAVVVRDVCEATGVSRGWFARHLVGRDELLDLARLDRLISFGRREAEAYEQALAAATDRTTLVAAFTEVIDRSRQPDFLAAAWDRLDLVVAVAAPGRERLAQDAGAVVAVGLARIAAALAEAQARGVIRADVPPQAVARFIWGYPLALLLGDVAGVPGDDMRELARRTNATLAA